MAILKPVPTVRQITRMRLFSCHLVEQEDGLTLIDTSLPGSAPRIAAEIRRSGKPLRRILLTHAHADHVGALDALVSAFPHIEVAATARTARLLAGDRSLDVDEAGLSLKGGFMSARTRPGIIAADGQDHAGFRAIETPGHAVGHVSWLQLDTGYLFAGDALISTGGGLHISGAFRLGFPFPYFATASRSQALESARKIAALAPTAIFPVHGPAVLDPAPALQVAIDEAEASWRHRSALA